jgi:outer membrane usher protein
MARWLRCAQIMFLMMAAMPLLAAATGPVVSSSSPPASPAAAEPAPAESNDETLYLDVQVNGHSIGKIGEFTLRHDSLWARPDELRDLGFRVPVSRASETGGLVALSDLPGLTSVLDEKNQVLQVTASDSALLPALLQPLGREPAGSRRVIESGTGVTLNYDTVGTFSGGQKGGSGSFETRAFSPWGIVSSDWLAFAGANSSAAGATTAIRLDSSYTFADVNSLRRYSLGDFINGGLSWTRPVHLEGVQINSDFSMRPDLVTFPVPTITGSAAVPSTVNVLTDGNLAASSQVAPGPFEIPQLPVVEGAGTISMTVTNAMGQQVTVTQPFYASSTMLAPGLQTFAVQAGLVRRYWGSVSNDYGKLAGAAVYRRGLSRKFTIESSIEGTQGAFMAGAGGVAQIGNLGVVNFSMAPSFGSGQAGAQFSAGAQRIGRVFSLSASAIMADRNYRDVASENGDGVPRKQLSAFTGLSLRRFGSGGLAYAAVNMDPSPVPLQQNANPAQHSQIVSAELFAPGPPRLSLRHGVSRPGEQRQQWPADWPDNPIWQAQFGYRQRRLRRFRSDRCATAGANRRRLGLPGLLIRRRFNPCICPGTIQVARRLVHGRSRQRQRGDDCAPRNSRRILFRRWRAVPFEHHLRQLRRG